MSLNQILDRLEIYFNEESVVDGKKVFEQAILAWVAELFDDLEATATYDPRGSHPVIQPRELAKLRNRAGL